MVREADRHELYAAAEGALGERPAATLMELLVPVDWSEIARKSDIAELRGEIAELRGELKADIAQLRLEMGELYHRLVTAFVMVAIALTGLVFTVAKAA